MEDYRGYFAEEMDFRDREEKLWSYSECKDREQVKGFRSSNGCSHSETRNKINLFYLIDKGYFRQSYQFCVECGMTLKKGTLIPTTKENYQRGI